MSAAAASPSDGSFRQFVADVRRAVAIARAVPWLPAIELALVVFVAAANHLTSVPEPSAPAEFASFLGLVVYASLIGWLGVQRVVFKRVMVGEPVDLGQVGDLLREQGPRYVRLAVVLLPVAAIGLAIAASTTENLGELDAQVSTAGQVAILLVTVALGIALTLVTPALSLSQEKATEAVSVGLQRLRTNFRDVRWHALLQPIAFAGAAAPLGTSSAVTDVLVLAAGSVAFLARGATIAAWLRLEDAGANRKN